MFFANARVFDGTGRAPFSGESPVAIAYKHVQEQPAPPRHLNTNVPTDLEAIILKLLNREVVIK